MKRLVALALMLLLENPALAATRNWTGSTDGSWSTAANWDGAAPGTGDDLVFAAAANGNALSDDFAPGFAFGSLAFANANAVFSATGNGVVLARGIANSGATVNLGMPLALGASQGWSTTSIGALVLHPAAALALGAHTLTIGGTGVVQFGGNTVGGSGGIAVEDAATLRVNHGVLEYTGTTTVGGAARLELFTTDPVATPVVIGAGGRLFTFPLNSAATGVLDAPLSILPGGTFQVSLDGTLPSQYSHLRVNAGPVTLGGNLEVTNLTSSAPGSLFVLIENATGVPVLGTFAGLPEGARVDAGGQAFRISYAGGSGGDVTLTTLPAPLADARSIPTLTSSTLLLLALALGTVGVRTAGKRR